MKVLQARTKSATLKLFYFIFFKLCKYLTLGKTENSKLTLHWYQRNIILERKRAKIIWNEMHDMYY